MTTGWVKYVNKFYPLHVIAGSDLDARPAVYNYVNSHYDSDPKIDVGDMRFASMPFTSPSVAPGDIWWAIRFNGVTNSVAQSIDYYLHETVVTDIVTDPNFTPEALSGGENSIILYRFTYDERYVDYIPYKEDGYYWVRADVSIVDTNGNGYDDRGEHDTSLPLLPPTLPPFDLPNVPAPISLDRHDADVVNDALSVFQSFADAATHGEVSATAAVEALGRTLPVLSEAIDVAGYLTDIYGSSDPGRTAFTEGVNLTLKTALTIGAVLTVAVPPVAITFAAARLIYTVAAEKHVTQLLDSWWNSTHGIAQHGIEAANSSVMTLADLSDAIRQIVATDSVVLDEKYYLTQHPDVAVGLKNGTIASVLSHYLTVGVAKGYQPNAQTAALAPDQVVTALVAGDPAAGSHVDARILPNGYYFGDGMSLAESALTQAINQQRAGNSALVLDDTLFGLANRTAIDLVTNVTTAPQILAASGHIPDVRATVARIAANFDGFNMARLSAYMVVGDGLSASEVMQRLLSDSDAARAISSGSNLAVGVAEYGGVWVLLLDSGAQARFAAPADDVAPLLLFGGDVADYLVAGTRTATFHGGLGDDHLIGGAGNDILDGGAGADSLYGGAGNDTYYIDRQADLVFENAGGGTDSVITTASYYLYANIENLTLAAGAGAIFGVGNELANTITGNEGANMLLAGAGADTVHGGAGVDIVYGQDGADQLFGDADNDVLVGGAGNDMLDGGAGGDGLYGEDGDDTLWGGTDFVFDQLVGGAGNDVLHGDSGLGDFDYLIGNTGDDSYYVDTYADLVFENAGEGTDTVYASTAAGSGYYLYTNIENLILVGNTFYGVGNELANRMTGSALDNWLLGGAGNDVLNGKGGNDVLFGQDGADTFVFEHGTGGDTIADFAAGTDRIDLSAFGFANFAAVQAAMSENGGATAIVLGGGDFIVLQGVGNAALHAGDFILSGGSSAEVPVEQLVHGDASADPSEPRWGLVHQFDVPHMMVNPGSGLDHGLYL